MGKKEQQQAPALAIFVQGVLCGCGRLAGDGRRARVFYRPGRDATHLGVGHTVWGHVVDEDLRRIGAFAKSHAGTGGALTFTLERLSAPLL